MSIVKKSSKSSIDKGLNTSLALDQSNHNLNNSSSKQKFSFPKASRFDLSKSMYKNYNFSDVIHIMMFHHHAMADQPLLGMVIKIWESVQIVMLQSHALTILKANFKDQLNPREGHHLELEDK